MSKKLTFKDIKSENKKYEEKIKVDISNDYYLYIYPHFSLKSITELIKEILTDPQRAKEADINFDEIDMGDWILFNVVYKFADLGIHNDDIKKKVQVFTQLINFDYYGKIIEAFPQESMNKLYDTMNRFKDNYTALNQNNLENEIEKLLGEDEIIQ